MKLFRAAHKKLSIAIGNIRDPHIFIRMITQMFFEKNKKE